MSGQLLYRYSSFMWSVRACVLLCTIVRDLTLWLIVPSSVPPCHQDFAFDLLRGLKNAAQVDDEAVPLWDVLVAYATDNIVQKLANEFGNKCTCVLL